MAVPVTTAYPVQQDAVVFWNNAVSAWQVVADIQPLPVYSSTGTEDNAGTPGSLSSVKALYRSRSVSAANASQQVVVDLSNLHDTLAILSAASGGTATLLVEASADNTNWITIDSLTAALTQTKQYTATTVGASTALSPLSFRWVRITAGAAGLGNTTTLTIAAK